jgi:hypothetical protein
VTNKQKGQRSLLDLTLKTNTRGDRELRLSIGPALAAIAVAVVYFFVTAISGPPISFGGLIQILHRIGM